MELDGDDNGVKDGNIDDIDMVNVDIDVFFNIGSDDCQYEGIKAICPRYEDLSKKSARFSDGKFAVATAEAPPRGAGKAEEKRETCRSWL